MQYILNRMGQDMSAHAHSIFAGINITNGSGIADIIIWALFTEVFRNGKVAVDVNSPNTNGNQACYLLAMSVFLIR